MLTADLRGGQGVVQSRVPLVFGLAVAVPLGSMLLAGAASGAIAQEQPLPRVEITCGVDACRADAVYVVPERDDDHEVAFRWETRPAPTHPDNRGDWLEHRFAAGTGQPNQTGDGFVHRVADVVWHSDIRCDDTVEVTLHVPETSPVSARTGKSVPDDPAEAFCSAHGM